MPDRTRLNKTVVVDRALVDSYRARPSCNTRNEL
jgi:hypothetical protein